MKIDLKVLASMLLGGALLFAFHALVDEKTTLLPQASASQTVDNRNDGLKSCEVFFSDNRDRFEEEINNRIKNVRLLQSNVLWSETTKQIGFYALICY